MSPLITAWKRYRDCINLDIRVQSLYFGQWCEMCNELMAWCIELEENL